MYGGRITGEMLPVWLTLTPLFVLFCFCHIHTHFYLLRFLLTNLKKIDLFYKKAINLETEVEVEKLFLKTACRLILELVNMLFYSTVQIDLQM